jgi:outer membrane protein assembly factor BamA
MPRQGCVLGVILLLALPLGAQKPVKDPGASGASSPQEASQESFPLRAIEFIGNDNFPEEQLIEFSGLRLGEQVTQADFERALEKLNGAGVFDSLEFRYQPKDDGYKVSYTVSEVGLLYPVRLEGFDVPEEELLKLLREQVPLFGPKIPPTGPMIDRIGNTLQTFWREKGHDSKIAGRLYPITDEEFEMLFQPEAAIQSIAFVQFENSGVVPALDLQRRFNQVAMGVPYSEPRLKELLHFNIRPMYEEQGYLEVEFCPCRTEPDPDTRGLLVNIHVEQGKPFTFGKIELPQNLPVSPEQVTKLLKVAAGETANMKRVRDGLRSLEEALKRRGHMKADARFSRVLDTEHKTVDISIAVEAGPQYTFNRLTITGLDVISEPAVRKRWSLEVGEAFDAGYPAFFLERVRDMFDNLTRTDWRMKIDEGKSTVDVELIFVGAEEESKAKPK